MTKAHDQSPTSPLYVTKLSFSFTYTHFYSDPYMRVYIQEKGNRIKNQQQRRDGKKKEEG